MNALSPWQPRQRKKWETLRERSPDFCQRFFFHTYSPNAHPQAKLLFDEMNRQRVSICGLAKKVGTSDKTIRDWKSKYVPSFDILEACWNALGYHLVPMKVRKKDDKTSNDTCTAKNFAER